MNRPSSSQFSPFSGPDVGEETTQRRVGPSHDALPPGTRFAEYELLSVLGEGQFGIVYLAMDHGLERQVAVKEYLPAALASRGRGMQVVLRSDGYAETFALGLRSFVDEARLLARFDHPALLRVYRFWEANGTAYMAMPYYEGITVDVVRQGMEHPPDETWLRDLLLPLLGALDVLHRAGCYHWDISPENILLLPDGRPVLLDSSAAPQMLGDGSQGATLVLNPGFAPIEQYAESTKLRRGPWTDLYALAAVAYYCVSGQTPLAATVRTLDDQMEPLSQVADRLGRSFPDLNYSVALVSAIERALSVRPQERPQSVEEFRRALLGGRGNGESVMVPPDGRSVEDASQARLEPGAPEAEPKRQTVPERDGETPRERVEDDTHDPDLWAALEAALAPDGDRFGGAPQSREDAKAHRRRRNMVMGGAAVALIALGAGGWKMWSDYREAKVMQRMTAPPMASDERRTPVLPPVPPATVQPERPVELPAGLPDSAASALPPGEAAAPEAVPSEAPSPEAAPVRDAPVEAPPPPAPVEKKEPNNPRLVCGSRTEFSLYRCMKAECERPKYYAHPECRYLRARDEVKAD